MMFFSSFVMAMLITLCLIPPLIRVAPRWKFMDAPDERKIHSGRIPRIGGVAIAIGALLPMLVWLPDNRESLWLIAAISVLLVFAIWDDRKNLHFSAKFFGQFLAAGFAVIGAGVQIHWPPFANHLPMAEPLSVVISILAVVGVTNALNLMDGLDGLAGGTTLLGFMVLGLLGWLAHDAWLVIMTLGITGATLGFLRYNNHPARIFMGDTGSQFLGFAASVIAIRLTQQSDIELNPLLPLLLLGIPIFDTFTVMAKRIASGKSPFYPDRNHIHHRLLDLGLDHYEVVIALYVTQAFLCVASFLLRYESDILVLGFIVIFFGALFGALFIGDKHRGFFGRRSRAVPTAVVSHRARYIRPLKNMALKIMLAVTPAILVAMSGYFAPREQPDLQIMACLIGLLFVLTSVIRPQQQLTAVEHVAQYILCSMAAFLCWQTSENSTQDILQLLAGFLFALTSAILIFPLSPQAKFELTPLDYLVILVAAFLAQLPVDNSPLQIMALVVSCLVMLLYIVEYIIDNRIFSAQQLRVGTSLAAICLAIGLHF